MKPTALIRVSVFLSLPALILSITSVIITGGYLQEIKALKVANTANVALLQEMFTAQNRAVCGKRSTSRIAIWPNRLTNRL